MVQVGGRSSEVAPGSSRMHPTHSGDEEGGAQRCGLQQHKGPPPQVQEFLFWPGFMNPDFSLLSH